MIRQDKQHAVFGLITGATTFITLQKLGKIDESWITIAESMSLVILGSLLPDIEQNESICYNIFKPIASRIRKIVKKRGCFHDLSINTILCIISILYVKNSYTEYLLFIGGFWFGVFSHLLLDCFTVQFWNIYSNDDRIFIVPIGINEEIRGIPVCYLFNKKLRLYLYLEGKKHRYICTGSGEANFIIVLLSIIIIAINLWILKSTVGLTF